MAYLMYSYLLQLANAPVTATSTQLHASAKHASQMSGKSQKKSMSD
jgi:hypothetical protein